MTINSNMQITEIKDLFAEKFNSLKIEFYKNPHKDHTGSAKDEQLSDDMSISNLANDSSDISIAIAPSMTVTELEEAFEQKGLHIQVFRWSKNLWLQTISSDHLTLEEQNRKGLQSNNA